MAWWIVGTAHLGTEPQRAPQPHLSRAGSELASCGNAEADANKADAVG
jgi:hypothetical protein